MIQFKQFVTESHALRYDFSKLSNEIDRIAPKALEKMNNLLEWHRLFPNKWIWDGEWNKNIFELSKDPMFLKRYYVDHIKIKNPYYKDQGVDETIIIPVYVVIEDFYFKKEKMSWGGVVIKHKVKSSHISAGTAHIGVPLYYTKNNFCNNFITITQRIHNLGIKETALNQIRQTLVHEIAHIIDPKLTGMNSTEIGKTKWGKTRKTTDPDYHTSVKEFDAESTEVIHDLKTYIKTKFLPEDHLHVIKTYMDWLRVDKTTQQDLSSRLYKNLSSFSHYIKHWVKDPELWKRFKIRIFHALQELKDELVKQPENMSFKNYVKRKK